MKTRKYRPLRPYQQDAIHYINHTQHSALFMDMRLGKTLIVVRWIKSQTNINKILIVAPYSAFAGWRKELRLEGEPRPLELIGTWTKRITKLNSPSKWYLINKEGHRVISELSDKKWDVVVLDESTFVKNPKTQASKFFVNNFRDVTRRFILTGTPAPEGELNYFQQLQFLNPTILNAKDYWDFRFRWFSEIKTGTHSIFSIRKAAKKKLTKSLADSCFFLKREDAGLKNIKIYEPRYIPLNPKAQKIYNTLKEEFLLEIDGEVIDKTNLAITQFIWMRRLFGGFVDKKLVFNRKFKELMSLLGGELKNTPVIVWCNFIQELKFLHSKIKNSKMIYGKVSPSDREKILRNFQLGKIPILLAQPECFKYGTDLSMSDTIIYYSTPLGLESRLQSEDRIVDLKKSSALIIDLIIEDTIEEDIIKSLKRKESKQEMILRIIRRLQNNEIRTVR